MAEEALRLLESEGTPTDVAWARTALGSILQSLGLGDEAEAFQRQALATFDAGGPPLGQCTASTALASIEWSRGHYASAESHYRHSLKARRQVGDPWGTAYVLTSLGWTRILQHDNEEAAEYLREAEPLFRRVRSLDGLANTLNGLGYVAAAEGRWNEAIERFEEALDLFREVGNRPLVALELSRLARAHLVLKEPERAFVFLREALEITGEIEGTGSSLFAVESLACLLAVGTHHVESARLFGAVDCLRREDQLLSDQTLPLTRTAFESMARDALGDAAAESHRADGCGLGHDRLRAEVESGLLLAGLRFAPAPTR
jgi:tetratricopeptide (TPR) repeat protein